MEWDYGRVLVWGGASVLLCAILHALIRLILDRKPASENSSNITVDKPEKENDAEDATDSSDKPAKLKKRPAWKSKTEYTHSWLIKSLKGHTGAVLHMDLSGNGKYLASTCEDGSVMIWDVRNLTQKEQRSVRVNIELDYANLVVWSPDSKAFVVHKVQDCCIQVYKVEKKKDGTIATAKPGLEFPKVHEEQAVGLGVASNGRFIMSCSAKTDLVLWDLKGEKMDVIDTYLINTYTAKVSPCGRFVIATGFSPDVKVREVLFSKSGDYKGTQAAYELTGHTSGVWDVAFDGVDTSHVATVSKDGTWKLYHTRIEYARGESPHVVRSGSCPPPSTGAPPRLALAPNAEVLVIAVDNSLHFYDTSTGDLYATVHAIFTGPITCVCFDASGKYVLAGGDRAVRVFHNVCGYHTAADTCRRLMATKQTSATMDRLKTTLKECEDMLNKFEV